MSYGTTIEGALDIEDALGENPLSKEEMLDVVRDLVEKAGDLSHWVNEIDISADEESDAIEINVLNVGSENSFGESIETFVHLLKDHDLWCCAEITAVGEDPNDRWKMEIECNEFTYLATEVVVNHHKVPSFRDMTEGRF